MRLGATDTSRDNPSPGGGEPIPGEVRTPIENSLQVSLKSVRVHSDSRAQSAAGNLNARAFTFGNQIFLGRGERPTDVGLMAHEAAHVVQQQEAPAVQRLSGDASDSFEREAHQASAAVVRQQPFTVHGRTFGTRAQRLGIRDALDFFADKANMIPGFRMFTIILGVNPINMSAVDRSAANILRAVIEFIPGGGLITQALDNYGIFDKIGNWVDQQIRSLGMTGSAIRQAVMDFLDSLHLSDLFHLGDVWDRAKAIFSGPIDRIISFAKSLVTGIITFIKDAILRPLGKLVEGTRGYDLLKAILGRDPVTGDAFPRTADTLIGGFMKLIGQEEIWNNMKKANAVARAWAWFQGAMAALMGFVGQIPSLFLAAFRSLELVDIILVPRAFAKIASVFGSFIGNFISWAGNAVWNLLQIIFEVVAPGAIPYIKKAAAAFKSILKNPLAFVGNLVKAGKLGFTQFASRIGAHLKAAFLEWLTGSLSGVYIPKALDLKEIVKFALSVMGITWANIRAKLVKVVGETAVKAMETGFEIVKTLVTQGPAAAWEQIKTQLANLRDMVMQGIMDFIIETVVKKAIAKVISLLVPGGAFIQAILSIYDTVMVFIAKLQKIIQVAMAFIDSIVAIANGAIGGAANKVEQTLAGLLTLAINFLAGFLGLGKIADKVMNIINTKVRAPIDKALDFVIAWIVAAAKKLGRFLAGKDGRSPEEKQRDLDKAIRELRPKVREVFRRGPPGRLFKLRVAMWKMQYKLTSLEVQPSGAVVATINPFGTVDQLVVLQSQQALAVIVDEIRQYQGTGRPNAETAGIVLATGAGTRQSPFRPAAAGNVTQGVQSVLSTPGGAPGETSWEVGTHAGRPVVAIIQRPNNPRSPGQGEVFAFDPATGRRVTMGAYPRSGDIPGVSSVVPGSGPNAASVVAGAFGGSGSRAAGFSEEMAIEGRVPGTLPIPAAQAAGAVTLLGAVEGNRSDLAMATVPSAMERSIRSNEPPPVTPAPLGSTMGGPAAPAGSARDNRLAVSALSRIDPQTGAPRAAGDPGIIKDPFPRGVKTPERSGSQTRAAGLMNASVDALANTILADMMDNGQILVLNMGDLAVIRQRTREFLVARYGPRR